MDTTTVILVLSIHLLCSGGLYVLIGRGMPARSGLNLWGVGCMLFGAAYVARLGIGLSRMPPWVVAMDVTMMLALLLFVSGLREFLGRPSLRWRTLAFAAGLYVLCHLAAYHLAGAVGRHLLQNTVFGALYLTLAIEGLGGRRTQPEALHTPLGVLAVLIGGLGAMTVVRSASVLFVGNDSLYFGALAKVYYGYASLAALLLELTLLWMVFVRMNGQLNELASRDALTRLLNRNGLQQAVERHFAGRTAQPLTLLQIDVDHFKRINDTHGHAAGDQVLRAIADALGARVRGSDFVARVGGEEFLVGCASEDEALATQLAQRLHEAVGALRVVVEEVAEPIACSVSIGISARCLTANGWDAAWQQADHALYAAKAAGRNRVFGFAPSGGGPVPALP